MSVTRTPQPDEVEELLLNGRLRDELEPFEDESLGSLNLRNLPTPAENDFLASMLAWERAPTLAISQWFQPELRPPRPDRLNDTELREQLWSLVHRLFERRIVLDFTDHLSDRDLYTLILRDILPSPEKKLDLPVHYLHWDCSCDIETWLRYYATDEERLAWVGEIEDPLPPSERPQHRRKLPRRPL